MRNLIRQLISTVAPLKEQHKLSVRLLVTAAIAATSLPFLLASAIPASAGFAGTNGLIAFVSDRDSNDEIYVTDEHGSQFKRLTNDSAIDSFPAVSPNGKEIAFTSSRGSDGNPNPEGDSEIYVMDATDDNGDFEGDDLRRLTFNAASESGPVWSPDGRKLAFVSRADGDADVYLMDPDGSAASVNVTDEALGQAPRDETQPRFSPDGTRIALGSNRDGNGDIYSINSDGSDPQRMTSSPALESHPDYSPDGSKLTFASNRDGDLDIYAMNAAPESAANIATNLTNPMSTNERFPVWSPDGTKIVFWSGVGSGLGLDAEIYVINANGSDPTNITNNDAGDALPDWGPAPSKRKHPAR